MVSRAHMRGEEPTVLSGVLYLGYYVKFCYELVKEMSHMRVVEHDVLSGLQSTGQYLEAKVQI